MLNLAKETYREKGCIGCHKFQGFDNQDEQLVNARQQIQQLEDTRAQYELDIPRLNKAGDRATSNDVSRQLYQQATNLTVTVSTTLTRRSSNSTNTLTTCCKRPKRSART